MNLYRKCGLVFSAAAGFVCLFAGNAALANDGVDEWRFTAGVGAFSQPKYPGSSSHRVSALPILSANYGRYLIGAVPGAGLPAGIGMYLVKDEHWHIGAGLGYNFTKPRKESDSSRLNGWGNIDKGTLGSIFASYSDSWWKVGGNVVTGIGGRGHGLRATLDLEAKYSPIDRLVLTAGPSVTWANTKYTQTFFGVSGSQSARSGLDQYDAKSGINLISFNVGANYQLSNQWGVGAKLTAGRLRGDAADSPVVGSKHQNTFGVFATYNF